MNSTIRVRVKVFNATFNNISVLSVEETGVPGTAQLKVYSFPKNIKKLKCFFFQDSKLNSDYDQSEEMLSQLKQGLILNLKLTTLN